MIDKILYYLKDDLSELPQNNIATGRYWNYPPI
jgi:hypothetical protein